MNVLVPLPGICLSAYQPDQTRGPKGHDADRKCTDARVGPRVAVDYADSGSSQGEPLLFLGRGSSDDRRSAAEGDSAPGKPPRSALIPKSHNCWRSRSRWSSLDRPAAALDGRDAFAAATNSASGSCPDAPGSRRG